jgi:hypothetical protein
MERTQRTMYGPLLSDTWAQNTIQLTNSQLC